MKRVASFPPESLGLRWGLRMLRPRLGQSRWSQAARKALPALLLSAVGVALWQVVVSLFDVSEFVVPAPAAVAQAFAEEWRLLQDSTVTTSLEVLYGFCLSIAVGVVLALLLGRFNIVDRAVYPLIVLFQSVPKVALAPLLILWFGFGLAPKVLLIMFIAFFPITVNTRAGLRSVDPDLVLLMRSVGASRNEILLRVQIPSSIPYFFVGLHIAITFSVIGAVVAEFAGAANGLGYLIQFSSSQLQTALVFASLILISVVGMVFYYAISAVELLVARRFPREEAQLVAP